MYRVQERTARIIIMMGITMDMNMDMDTVITMTWRRESGRIIEEAQGKG